MAEVYVTLGEAAELERVKYNTMVKRVLRKQEYPAITISLADKLLRMLGLADTTSVKKL